MNKETEIQRKIQIALCCHDCLVIRQQSGLFYDSSGNRVRAGVPGLSDLLVVRPDGQACFIEVKPDHKAHKRPEQIQFIKTMNHRGIRAGFATSTDEALSIVFDAPINDWRLP